MNYYSSFVLDNMEQRTENVIRKIIILNRSGFLHLVVEQQLPLVLCEAPADGRGSGAEPLLVDGDIKRFEVADPVPPCYAAAVVGRSGEEDGDRRIGELVERRRRLASDDVVLE